VLLQRLVSHDDWLPEIAAQPDPQRYQQFLLHADARQRFSVVSFIWGPGQSTPIHDHRVWGLIGMLRGAEFSQGFSRTADGRLAPEGAPIRLGPSKRYRPALGIFIRSTMPSTTASRSASMSTAPTSVP
jgi:3-mercaptopropionate dioxygenase